MHLKFFEFFFCLVGLQQSTPGSPYPGSSHQPQNGDGAEQSGQSEEEEENHQHGMRWENSRDTSNFAGSDLERDERLEPLGFQFAADGFDYNIEE